jgi:hypothetical protein
VNYKNGAECEQTWLPWFALFLGIAAVDLAADGATARLVAIYGPTNGMTADSNQRRLLNYLAQINRPARVSHRKGERGRNGSDAVCGQRLGFQEPARDRLTQLKGIRWRGWRRRCRAPSSPRPFGECGDVEQSAFG